ncbi:asparaginase [Streptomyces spectabilis]|uniref:Asparaginase n=1 Tax=Streptomyces spectabilis TaxID=68270 RepID=A0A5P2X538_STRST|nr:asparaginase [Streptomyces spectabilis]MBB5102934.1 L-asparaginase [Streptomyces spectabilis]MCI3902134.1 asparaginase [Streptomyces spectabilis]QEV59521.1 asparaginase [Streptomyces spectabilis]GGV15804.1 L-asparaginase [Streptomyces spectabilis]
MTTTVSVFTLGGTISAHSGGGSARLTGSQTLATVPVPDDVKTELHDFRRLPGSSLTLEDLAALAERVDEATAAGHGVVVVQGTDTLEETAFLLDVVCAPRTPIVVTGAMRRPDLPGADGPANLAAALAVAADPRCRGLGVLVVLADEIHAARHARKAHTTSLTTFASPGAGPLGRVVEGVPRILLRPQEPTVERPLRLRNAARVALLTLAIGDGGELLEAVDDGFDGLVVAAFGAGHAPQWLVEPLAARAARMPVVLASRTGAGPLLSETYRGPGSEADLLSRGLISAGSLDAPKARLLLHALLADGADRRAVEAAFHRLDGSGA